MRFVRNLGLVAFIVIISLKLTERFVLQSKLNDYSQSYLHSHKDKLTVETMTFEGDALSLSGIKIVGIDDSFSLVGFMQPVLLGWPGIDFMVRPSGSKIWEIAQIQGKTAIGLSHISAKKVLVQNLRFFHAPQLIVPETFISFDYDRSTGLIDLNIEIPQLGDATAKGQVFVTGRLDSKDAYSGKLSLRIINPGAVLEQFSQTGLTSKHQLSAIKGLITGLSNSQAEITLPLSLEKGALYLGPIRLYPKPSREDSLARIGEGVITNLFRTFARVPQ